MKSYLPVSPLASCLSQIAGEIPMPSRTIDKQKGTVNDKCLFVIDRPRLLSPLWVVVIFFLCTR